MLLLQPLLLPVMKLQAHLTARVVGEDKVFLLSEDRQLLLRGRAVAVVAPLLDGTRTEADIVAATAGRLSFAECVRALARFRGYLDDGAPPQRTVVNLVQLTEIDFREALRANGVEFGDGITVVLADDYLDPRLADLDVQRPWLLCKPTGREIWIGPHFRPGVTGCWHCLADRLDGNRPVGRYLRLTTGEAVRPPVVTTPATIGLAASLIANAVAAPPDALVSVRADTLDTERHQLIRQPQCAACGDAEPRPVKIELKNGRARHGRTMSPEDTLARLDKHVSRLLGAVTALKPLETGLAPSYVAGHNFALQPGNLDGLRRTLRGQSGGKGRTDAHAKASAVCEAIERFCGLWRDGHLETRATYPDVADIAISPDELLLFSDRQYKHGNKGRLHTVPPRFDPDKAISWSLAWSLTDERERLVPSGYAWFGHLDHGYCFPDANGNAAGNTLEEAILQGFCELVERDSVAIWWYNRLRRPGFDLAALNDPYVARLQEFYAELDRDLWVLDITADLGIPTFAAVSRRTGHEHEDVLLGFGSHLDTGEAVLRALTELNQFLPGVRDRLPDGSTDYREEDPDTLAWWRDVRVAEHDWLLPHGQVSTMHSHASRDVAADVRFCVETAREAGLEVVVLDQTRPDIELNVVKVLVPGMRHFWRRLGPGRLYDVPVRMGWLDTPTTEDGCNPVSVFF